MVGGIRELGALCAGFVATDVERELSGISLSDISLDSRTVTAGGLFLACAGRRTHGLAALPQALARGARAVLWEPAEGVAAPSVVAPVVAVRIDELSRQAGAIAARFFGEPSSQLAIAGITGTNGKTTTAWLLAEAMTRCGTPTAYAGTLGVGTVPNAVVPGEYTTADAVSVQRQLAALRAAGARSVAMEVSSHALDQHRVAAVRFRTAAFTNLTRDHLDYHGTMAAYGAAKARLFAFAGLESCVINVDDAFGAELAQAQRSDRALLLTARTDHGRAQIKDCRQRGFKVLELTASDVQASTSGLSLTLEARDPQGHVTTTALRLPLIGDFNVDNALTTLGLLCALDVPLHDALAALSSASPPPGRMEPIIAARQALAIVDYAHTPDALAKALRAARAHCAGRLHVVFGCGGDRDAGKRPLMAEVAATLADAVVITDDNPRSESPAVIVKDIVAGLPANVTVAVIHDREAAIREALRAARAGDVVVVAGKGHEDYQIVGSERLPFSDRAVVRCAQLETSAGVLH